MKLHPFLQWLLLGTAPLAAQSITYDGGDGDGSSAATFVGGVDGSASIFAGGQGDGHDAAAVLSQLGGSGLIDSDGDGMPDEFELLNGLNFSVNDAAGDLDGDGVDNLAEYVFCTDPQDPDDRTVLDVFPSVGLSTVGLLWSSVPGKEYLVYSSGDLTDWFLEGLVVGSAGANSATTVIIDGETRRFFRLQVDE